MPHHVVLVLCPLSSVLCSTSSVFCPLLPVLCRKFAVLCPPVHKRGRSYHYYRFHFRTSLEDDPTSDNYHTMCPFCEQAQKKPGESVAPYSSA